MIDNKKIHPIWSLYYEKEGFDISGDRIMGRQAAGHAYLKAVLNSGINNLGLYIRNESQKGFATEDVKSLLTESKSVEVTFIPFAKPHLSEPYGGIFFPGPDISSYARHRTYHGHEKYSVIGITHTTASHKAMTSIADLVMKPVMPWDAVICTSEVVLDTVNCIIEETFSEIKNRLEVKKLVLPMFPVIPLGVHTEDFNYSDDFKLTSRRNLGVDENDIVIVYVGRLSFHAKAHPLPMYLSLEACAKKNKGKNKIHLVQTGWFPNDQIERSFKEEAKKICPNIECHFLDGKNQSEKHKTLAAGDIFISLSDNIQETFGLTPLEGMASGLPVIVSDWNGYRSTVRNNLDGFTIPSYSLEKGFGKKLAYDYMVGLINYDTYIGMASQRVAVDVKKCIDKLEVLINNKDRRLDLGNKGKKRANRDFSWDKIIEKYMELSEELNNIRLANVRSAKTISPSLLPSDRMDPFNIFSSYPSHILGEKTVIYKTKGVIDYKISDILDFTSVNYSVDSLSDKKFYERVIQFLKEDKYYSIEEINESIDLESSQINEIIIVLLKYGFVGVQGGDNG